MMKMVFYRCQAMHISCPLQIAKNIAIWPHLVDSDSDSDYSAASVRHLPSFVINSGPHRCPQQTTRTRHGHFVLNSNTALISPMHCTICW